MATSAALRQINQARILTTLRQGSWSRVALAQELGLNRSTATVIVNSLLEQGLVCEVDSVPHGQPANGRPRVGIALNGPGAYFGGLELGNQTLTAVITDLTGREIARAGAATVPGDGPVRAEEQLGDLLAQLLAQQGPGIELQGIGLTVPGVVSSAGRLDWAPWLDWSDVLLGASLQARFGIQVQVENDANAAALAEGELRSRQDGDNLLFLLLDAGVGGGLLVNRELYRGGAGRVGEVGHLQLPTSDDNPVAVEQVLGRQAVLDAAAAALGHPVSWEEVVAAVSSGQSEVADLLDRWQRTLGWLTAALAWTLDPDVIVFGGPVSLLLREDSSALQDSLRLNGPRGLDARWRLSTLVGQDTVGGAVALAMRDFFAIPALISRTRMVEAAS